MIVSQVMLTVGFGALHRSQFVSFSFLSLSIRVLVPAMAIAIGFLFFVLLFFSSFHLTSLCQSVFLPS